MSVHLFHRYIWLTDTIYRARRITLAEIRRRWLLSDLSEGQPLALRTFHNHRDAIEELFDINIACDVRTKEYYIENVDDLQSCNLTCWLLNSFSTANIVRESKTIRDRILLEEVPSAQYHLHDLLEAMRENLAIRIVYQSFREDFPMEFTLLPYFVKLHGRRWYVFGPTPENSTVKVYALDRILSLEVSDTVFEVPRDFSPEAHLSASIGITRYDDIPPCWIILKSYHPKYLRSLPLHHSQQEIETRENYSLFRYWLSPTPDFFQSILSFQDYVEVLSPVEVREQWLGIIDRMAAFRNYK